MVTHETRGDGEYTIVQGNTGGDNAAGLHAQPEG